METTFFRWSDRRGLCKLASMTGRYLGSEESNQRGVYSLKKMVRESVLSERVLSFKVCIPVHRRQSGSCIHKHASKEIFRPPHTKHNTSLIRDSYLLSLESSVTLN